MKFADDSNSEDPYELARAWQKQQQEQEEREHYRRFNAILVEDALGREEIHELATMLIPAAVEAALDRLKRGSPLYNGAQLINIPVRRDYKNRGRKRAKSTPEEKAEAFAWPLPSLGRDFFLTEDGKFIGPFMPSPSLLFENTRAYFELETLHLYQLKVLHEEIKSFSTNR